MLHVTEVAPIAENGKVTCGSHDVPNENEQHSLELFTTPPSIVSKPDVGGAGAISCSESSSLGALNTAFIYQTSESLSGAAEAGYDNSCPMNSIPSHCAGSSCGTGSREVFPNPMEGSSSPESEGNVVTGNSDNTESLFQSSDLDMDISRNSDTDYDSDFASNRAYFEKRRKQVGTVLQEAPSLRSRDMLKKTISKRIRKKLKVETRGLRHRFLRQLKRRRRARKVMMWRINRKRRRTGSVARSIRFPRKKAMGRCVL